MIAVLQRVAEARVTIDGHSNGEIGRGLLILLGVAKEDTEEDCRLLYEKIPKLRICLSPTSAEKHSSCRISPCLPHTAKETVRTS